MQNVHKEERRCWRASVSDEYILDFFIYFIFTILFSFLLFTKLLFKFFPRLFNDKPILLVVDS